jgi:hypothetical protein
MLPFLIVLAIVSTFYLFSGIIRGVVFWRKYGRPSGQEWLMLLAIILLWPWTIYKD